MKNKIILLTILLIYYIYYNIYNILNIYVRNSGNANVKSGKVEK